MRLIAWIAPAAGSALLLIAAAGCGDGSEAPGESEPALRGAALVLGEAAEEWSLLTVPRSGGTASVRSLGDPDSEVWTGHTRLPPASEVHAVEGGLVVLRTADGTVFTYDAPAEVLKEIGAVGVEAVWVGRGGAGVYYEPEGEHVLQVSRSGSWRYELTDAVAWAGPVESGVMALVPARDRGAALWLLHSGESEPTARSAFRIAPPALVTAWGRRALFLDAEDGAALRIVSVEPLELAGRLELDRAATALAASPSSHEVFAALDSPPALVAVSRFTGAHRDLAALPAPASELRTGVFGECVFVRSGDGVYRVPIGGGAATDLGVEWRSDLPIGLPGRRTLAVRAGSVVVVGDEGRASPLSAEAGTDSWWAVVRWNPARARVVADRVEAAPLSDSAGTADAGATEGDGAEQVAGDDAAKQAPALPAGFYAIVGSARQRNGILSLAGALGEAGYRTAVQAVDDDAGRRWHRALVGPFPTRREAEAAARQLLRERRLQAWVTEIQAAEPSGEGRESGD